LELLAKDLPALQVHAIFEMMAQLAEDWGVVLAKDSIAI
jgi:hypothetical protein